MFDRKVIKILLGSTILSSLFSIGMIALTLFHHMRIEELIKENKSQSNQS